MITAVDPVEPGIPVALLELAARAAGLAGAAVAGVGAAGGVIRICNLLYKTRTGTDPLASLQINTVAYHCASHAVPRTRALDSARDHARGRTPAPASSAG